MGLRGMQGGEVMKLLSFPTQSTLPPERSIGRTETASLYLPPRYRRVLERLSQGMTVREVADVLKLKPATAWNYMEEIFLKNPEMRQRLAVVALELAGGLQRNVR